VLEEIYQCFGAKPPLAGAHDAAQSVTAFEMLLHATLPAEEMRRQRFEIQKLADAYEHFGSPRLLAGLSLSELTEHVRRFNPDYDHSVYLSPTEVVALLDNQSAMDAMKHAVTECMRFKGDSIAIRSFAERTWAAHAGRIEVAGWIFNAIGLVPLPLLGGAATALGEVLIGALARHGSWRFTLHSLQCRIDAELGSGRTSAL